MAMTPTEMRECLELIGWSLRELARRLRMNNDAPLRRQAMGKRPIHDNLAAWLKMFAAFYASLPPEVRAMARATKCDEGRFIRRPVGQGVRDLVPDEWVATLELLAALHAAFPYPLGLLAALEDRARHAAGDDEG